MNNLFNSNKHIRICILYGSQLGNTEVIAKILFSKIDILYKEIYEMNKIEDISKLNNYDYIIFLISTTGDGDFPDNSRLFWKLLRKNKEKINIKYILIGFGDSNYNSFCHTAKCMDRILKKNEKAIETEYIDDATDENDKIDNWIKKVVKFIKDKDKEIKSWFTWSMNNFK